MTRNNSDVGDLPMSLELLQRRVMAQANANEALRQCLNEGAVLLGTYHAQLGIDDLRQDDHHSAIQKEFEELVQEEQYLTQRLDFLFQDAQRLEGDNAAIIKGFEATDTAIKETQRLLELEEQKYNDVGKQTAQVQSELLTASKSLVALKNALRDTKRSRMTRLQAVWDTIDDVDRLREVVQVARDEMTFLEQRIKAATAARLHHATVMTSIPHAVATKQQRNTTSMASRSTMQAQSSLLSERQPTTRRTGGSATSSNASNMGLSMTTAVVQPTTAVGPGGCCRPDCVAVACRIAELEGAGVATTFGGSVSD